MTNKSNKGQSNDSVLKELEFLKRENSRLRNLVTRLEDLFQNTTIGVYQTTPEGIVTQANNPLIRMLGYDSLDDMQQHNLEDDELIESRDRRIFKERIEKEGIIIGHETQWLKKDGKKIFIRESARAIKDSTGKIIFYEGTVEDITSRKTKEIELIDSEERYRKLVEMMPNGLIIHKDGKIKYANDTVLRALKLKKNQSIEGKNIFDYIHTDFHKLITTRLEESLKNQTPTGTAEEVFIIANDQKIDVEARTIPFEINGESHFLTIVTDITEQKKSETELKLSEITYRGILNNISEAIFIQNEDGSFVDVNKAAETLYGFEHNYFIDRSPNDLSAGLQNNLKEIEKLVRLAYAGKPQLLQFWGKKSNGTVFPTEVSIVPGLYFGKKVVIAVVRDTTERIATEEKLRENERKYRELIDFAVGGILLGSNEGVIINANSYICTLMGRKAEDIIGKHISEGFFTEESIKKSPFAFDLLREGKIVINKREIIRPDGSVVPIEMHSKVMPDGTFQSIYHDISDRLMAEEQIIESKEEAEKLNLHKEALLKGIPDILFTFNAKGEIIDFYSNSEDVLFAEPRFFMNKNVTEILPSEIAEKTLKYIADVLQNKEMAIYTYLLKINNEPKDFEARMVYLNEDTVLAVVRNVTERMTLISDLNKAKIKAEESDKLKTAFLANMSHEIRTPMNGILGFTELLKEDVSEEERHEYIEIIESSCNQLLLILNDIVEISKIEVGIISKKVEPIALKEFILQTYSSLQGLLPKHRDIRFILSDQILTQNIICFTDPVKLKQILSNLVSNAFKFTESGIVELGYYQTSDSFIEFYVKDTGFGIPKKDHERIFNRFVQIDNKFAVQNSGSGLGLSICKAYCELLGGTIRVESEENKGSCFYVNIPLIS